MSAGRWRPTWAAPGLMVGAALLFSLMAVLVKLASAHYTTGEIVFYRGLVGAALVAAVTRWQGGTLRTRMPATHFWRGLTGVVALTLWFVAIGGLPLGTAMTLNSMSSVWMALFLIGGSLMMGAVRVESRLVAAVLAGFVGVALVLQPTLQPHQVWHALAGLLSGVLAATAYLQVIALGRAGEPEYRVVFYFSLGSMAMGGVWMAATPRSAHDAWGLMQLAGIGLLAAVAQMMMTRAYAVGHTLVNSALAYMSIAFSFLFGVTFFDEPLSLTAMVGVALIVGAGLTATALRSRHAPDTGHVGANTEP